MALYQIAEVYARSWIVVGAAAGGVVPKNIASHVVHRGVGISITRT